MKRPLPKLPIGGKYIDILTDWSLKRIFSGESNKKNLIELLNDLLADEKHIRDLTYMPTEELGGNDHHRRIIFDLKCVGANGEIFLIKMQRVAHRNFRDRTVFSTSRIISNHYTQGDDYRDVALPEVYFIGILEFRMDVDERERYIRRVELADRDTGKVFYSKLKYIFLELTNFVKRDEEIRTDMDQWFWLFKHLSEASRLPAFMKKRVFRRIFDIAEIANLTTEELMAYNASIQAKWDWENAIALAEERAAEKAVEKTLKKERAKVEAEKIQSVRKMLTKGLSVADAAEISGLSVKEITEIQIHQKGK